MAPLGWKEGSNYAFEERWADGFADRLPTLAGELVAKSPALIVATPAVAARAAAKAAPKTPIIYIGGDPVSAGLAASYARPGGMVTGFSTVNTEVSEKYLELLLAAAPNLRRVGFLFDVGNPNLAMHKENVHRSLAQHKVEARFAEVTRSDEIELALSRLAKEGVQALVILPGPMEQAERRRIARLALAQRWPTIGEGSRLLAAGGLLSYGVDHRSIYRRAAFYVDRVLKGTKPGDLPIELPTKFVLRINMKTAKLLGIEISRELAVRADRVIE